MFVFVFVKEFEVEFIGDIITGLLFVTLIKFGWLVEEIGVIEALFWLTLFGDMTKGAEELNDGLVSIFKLLNILSYKDPTNFFLNY